MPEATSRPLDRPELAMIPCAVRTSRLLLLEEHVQVVQRRRAARRTRRSWVGADTPAGRRCQANPSLAIRPGSPGIYAVRSLVESHAPTLPGTRFEGWGRLWSSWLSRWPRALVDRPGGARTVARATRCSRQPLAGQPTGRPRWCARGSAYRPAVPLLWANLGRVLLARDISGVSQQTVQYSVDSLEYIG
jgi:hypothetical protein